MSHIRHYLVLPWTAGPLTSLESIAKVPGWQVAKTGKSSIFWLLLSFFLSSSLSHASTITVEAIKTIQTRKKGTNHWVYCTHHLSLSKNSDWLAVLPHSCTCMLATIRHFSKRKLRHWPEFRNWPRVYQLPWIYEFIWSERVWISN